MSQKKGGNEYRRCELLSNIHMSVSVLTFPIAFWEPVWSEDLYKQQEAQNDVFVNQERLW